MKKKGNFLGNLFAILILLAIVSYLLPLIKIAIAIFVIWVVLVLISCNIKHKKEKQHENNIIDINPNQYVFSSDVKQDSIKRQVEILTESIQLVNESNNLDTVLKRYLITYNTLNKLLLYKDNELRNAGYTLKQSISETQNHMLQNRVVIINQAIERNIKHELNTSDTINVKMKKLDTLYERIKHNENLDKDNVEFLENLYRNIRNDFFEQDSSTHNNPENVSSEQQEIYSTTIFLWATRKCHTKDETQSKSFYQQYLIYDYGISDPVNFYNTLFEQGFYALADAREVLENYKVTKLKTILESAGEKKSGKKEELIQRIINSVPKEMLDQLSCTAQLYTLSQKGKEYIKKHEDLIYLHKKRNSWNILLSEYEAAKQQLSFNQYTFRDVAWVVFNNRIHKMYERQDISFVSSVYRDMAQLLFEFDNNQQQGTFFLLVALYCEINGTHFFYNIKNFYDGYITKEQLKEFYYEIFIEDTTDFILDRTNYIDQIDLEKVFNFVKLPMQICSKSDFILLVEDLKHASTFDTEKWNAFFEKKYQQYITTLT